MKITFKKGYVQVESKRLVVFIGRLSTGTDKALAAAFFPFVFVRDATFTPDWLINHELIHFRQELETIFIGGFLLTFIERLYARFVLKKSREQCYLYSAMEQEAYLNMYNLEYLKTRKWYSLFQYITHKREFELTGPGEMNFLD